MLTFYPEFEAESISENEIILFLDLSNSMKVTYSLFIAILVHNFVYMPITLSPSLSLSLLLSLPLSLSLSHILSHSLSL